MNQQALDLNLCTRRTRKMELLELMEGVVPWREFVSQLTAVAPPKATGRPPFAHETMLRLHLLQQLFGLSDFAMEEALFDTPLYRTFAGLGNTGRLPARVSILRFRHLMEGHDLAKRFFETVNDMLRAKGLMLQSGTVVDATIIAAPSSTKNSTGKRDPEMHQTKKGNQWHHGMKAHIGADADSGLVHAVVGTAANVNDVTQAHALVHGTEADVYADAGYLGVAKREEVQDVDATWHIAMRPGKRRALDKQSPLGATLDKIEQLKASICAKVEHPYYQAPVWSHQGSLPWIEEEHGAPLHPVYALEPVDGEEAIYANHCMSAPKYCQTVGIDRQKGRIARQQALVSSKFESYVLASEIHLTKLVLTVSFGHHP